MPAGFFNTNTKTQVSKSTLAAVAMAAWGFEKVCGLLSVRNKHRKPAQVNQVLCKTFMKQFGKAGAPKRAAHQ